MYIIRYISYFMNQNEKAPISSMILERIRAYFLFSSIVYNWKTLKIFLSPFVTRHLYIALFHKKK